MKLTLKQAIFMVLAAVIVVGGYFSWQFIAEQNKPVVPPKNYKIGFLLTDKDIGSANITGFKGGMEKAGYKEGVNITYIEKNAGADRATIIDGYAKDLNDAGLDLIIISSTSAGKALQKLQDAGKLQTKIFFLAVGSPRDLVKNLQFPEGFITGIGEGTVEFTGKRLEFLKELVPNMRKVISVVEKGSTNEKLFKEKLAETSTKIGVEMVYIDIDTKKPDEILQKLPLLTKKLGDAYITCPCKSNDQGTYAKPLAAQLLKAGLPSISTELKSGANIGFLATYSDDREKTGEAGAVLVDKILKGMPINNVPVSFAKDVILEINLKTAKSLGITIPQSILSGANKVYNE